MIRRPPRATRTDTLFPTRRSAVLGEAALARAVEAVRGRGGIVLLVAHRRSILSSVGHVLHLAGGRMKAFGPREKLLSEMRSEEHTSELQSLMRISYAVFCLKKKKKKQRTHKR